MVKFGKLTKLKIISALIIFIKYSLWCFFFTLQGKAIDMAIHKNILYKQLVFTLAGYILIKIMVMICDLFQKFIIAYYKNIDLKQLWNTYFPEKIYRDTKDNQNYINILFFDYFPKLFDMEISILNNKATLYYIFSLTIAAFLYTGFFVGILALILVFFMNYLSKNIFTQQLDKYQIEANDSKIKILNWVHQYFNAFREISKNWQGIATSSWKNEVYDKYFTAVNNQVFYYLYRDLLSQLLVELPFLLNTSVVILSIYYGYLSLTQLFVWVGFSQFMINASNAYLENRVNKKQRATLYSQASSILSDFKCEGRKDKTVTTISKSFLVEATLRDGTKNTLSLLPGVYAIKGSNGSGKSTLMNIILNHERKYRTFENTNLSPIMEATNQDNIRVIERDAAVFDCFDDFKSQICGPFNKTNDQWKNQIHHSINALLAPSLAKKWWEIFISLESLYTTRKDKVMSSGEKIILSFMRFFSSWNSQVNLLIIDECDSFLDYDKKRLFIQAINNLSSYMAVYVSSHDASFIQTRGTVYEV